MTDDQHQPEDDEAETVPVKKQWHPGMTAPRFNAQHGIRPAPFARPARRFDNAEDLDKAGSDPGATFYPGSSRLGEGDGFLSRKVRERRAEGANIDIQIASAFVDGFTGGVGHTVDAKAILEQRARTEHEQRERRRLGGPSPAEDRARRQLSAWAWMTRVAREDCIRKGTVHQPWGELEATTPDRGVTL